VRSSIIIPPDEQFISDNIERNKLQFEALGIFKEVVGEWKSDPMSVQCFDLRIVKRALEIDNRLKELK